MTIQVHGAPLSPYVRKLRIMLAEKGIDYELKMAVPYDLPEGYEKLNPLMRIPAYQDEEVTLADSAVICHYIEQKESSTPLMPSSPAARAQCEWLEKYADYELAPYTTATIFRHTLILPLIKLSTNHTLITQAKEQHLPPLFHYLSEQLGDNDWFVENTFSLADIAIACQLINMEHAKHTLDENRWPTLHAFLQRCYARESFSAILPQEQKQIEQILAHING